MKLDKIELLTFFDEVLPLTNEERGEYWYKLTRHDEIYVTLAVSIYENIIIVSLYTSLHICVANIELRNCSQIRILDKNKKILEILQESEKGRCLLTLLDKNIIDYAG